MSLLEPMDGLSAEESEFVDVIAKWVDNEVRPVVRDLEHSDTYPAALINQMKELGVYGLAIGEPWNSGSVSGRCYARITEEIARGWMSLSGAFGGHSVVSKLLTRHGTPQQQERYLPLMATGELRATMALTEPDGGSDLQAIRTVARPTSRDGVDGYVINGAKTWITNSRMSDVIALLCKPTRKQPPRIPEFRFCSSRKFQVSPWVATCQNLGTKVLRVVSSHSTIALFLHRPCWAERKVKASPR